MKIQPEANNAILLELEDDSIFRLHNSMHGNKDYLFITNCDIKIEKCEGLEYKKLFEGTNIIRISIRGKSKNQSNPPDKYDVADLSCDMED